MWQENFDSNDKDLDLNFQNHFSKQPNIDMTDEDRIFIDRRDAGLEVGRLLEQKYKDENPLVLGIARGGVIVAAEVARVLNGELSVIITKKLPHPLHEEYAIGAAAEDGSVFLTSAARSFDASTIKRIVKAQSREIESRIKRFRKGKPLPEILNRVVIIVDDGIATGSTIVPAVKLCKLRKAKKIIVAAPVSDGYVSELDAFADEVVIAERPENFYAVGQAYDDFHHLSDEEVISAVDEFQTVKK
jgi:putative phosphoribosyl transferase